MRDILFLSSSAPPFLPSLYRRKDRVLKCAIEVKNKRTTISNDTLMTIKSPQNALKRPLSLPLSLPSDVSSAVSVLLLH